MAPSARRWVRAGWPHHAWPDGDVAIVGATVLDGTGGPPVHDAAVVIVDGMIAALGPQANVSAPDDAAVVDAEGAWIVPGVVDAHVHLAFAGDPVRMLRRGVTAVRDLGWPPARLSALRRQAAGAGLLVQHVGPILTPPGGYPTLARWAPAGTGREVGSADEARGAIDEAAAAGACAVKVAMEDSAGPVFDLDLLTAIVEHSHAHGLPTTVHAGSAEAVETCLAAGVDELAHVPFSLVSAASDLPQRCAASGMRLIPTLHCRHGDTEPDRAAAVAFLQRWVAAKGTVAYGTDLGNAFTAPGVDAEELLLLQAGGLDASEVLVAATSAAATAIGAGDVVGRIAPGWRADLLVLREDPLVDVTALARANVVIAEGRRVSPPARRWRSSRSRGR